MKDIHLFANSNPIKKQEKMQKISDFWPSDYSDYGAFSSDYGQRLWRKNASDFCKYASDFPATMGNPQKIRKFPEKWEENRFFEGEKGAKTEKWEFFPFFKEKRPRMQPIPGASVYPSRAARSASFILSCIGIAAGNKTRHGPLYGNGGCLEVWAQKNRGIMSPGYSLYILSFSLPDPFV